MCGEQLAIPAASADRRGCSLHRSFEPCTPSAWNETSDPPLFLLIKQLYRTRLLETLHSSSVVHRWNLEVVFHCCFSSGGSWYNPSAKFLLGKFVKIYCITNLVLAQREITNGLLHPALKGVWAHGHKVCNRQREYHSCHQICGDRAGHGTRKPFLKC